MSTPTSVEKPSFAAQNAVIFGLGMGNMAILTLVTTTVGFFTNSFGWTLSACILMLVLSVPLSMYLIRRGTLAAAMQSPAEIIGGFVWCVAAGVILPCVVIPGIIWGICYAARQAHQEANPWGKRKHTGKEAFYSAPASFARYAEHEMTVSFFAEHKG